MPNRQPGLTYRELRDALREVHRTLGTVLQAQLTRATRIQLQTLADMLDRTLAKDDGRVR